MAASAAACGAAGLLGKRKCAAGASALRSLLFLAVALAGMATPSAAAVYKVGDSAGWTIIGNVNYSAWAASKTFHVGDVLEFDYNKLFHNVEDVNEADYRSCNAGSPKATYSTGKDSITLKTPGHHYFLCGVPTHCGLGQKVDVNALQSSTAAPTAAPGATTPPTPSISTPPATSPEAGGSTGSGSGQGAPAPVQSGAAPGNLVMAFAVALLAVAMSSLRM